MNMKCKDNTSTTQYCVVPQSGLNACLLPSLSLTHVESTHDGLHFDQGSENGISKATAIPSLKSVSKDG